MDILKRTFNSEIKGIDETARTLTAYVSTNATDRMDEVLEPKGADLKNFRKNPVVLFGHDYNSPPIGRAQWIKRDAVGLLSKVEFANTEFAKEIFNLYKDGFMKAFSVGFIPQEWEDGDGKKKASRTYTKWELLEYSAVPVPANPEALMLAMEKGILKSDTVKKALGLEVEFKELPEDENLEEPVETQKAVDELIDEMELLESRLTLAEAENTELRVALFEAYATRKKLKQSGIADIDIAQVVGDTVVGAIRRMSGKIK